MRQIPPIPEKVPLIDPATGLVHRDWLIWLTRLKTIIEGIP